MKTHRIRFVGDTHQPIDLPEGANLSEYLTVENAPVLFGCRTGICGTCVIDAEGALPPRSEDELEVLELYAPGNPKARLACQIELCCDLVIGVAGGGG